MSVRGIEPRTLHNGAATETLTLKVGGDGFEPPISWTQATSLDQTRPSARKPQVGEVRFELTSLLTLDSG